MADSSIFEQLQLAWDFKELPVGWYGLKYAC